MQPRQVVESISNAFEDTRRVHADQGGAGHYHMGFCLITLDELEDALTMVIKGNSGVPQEVVDRVADRFHAFRDAGSSERVYSEIRRRFVDA